MTRVLAVSAAREVMGTEHSLLNVTPALSSHGVEMMLTAEGGGSLERRWSELGLDFHPLKLPDRGGFRPNTGEGYHGIGELARLPFRTVRAVIAIMRVVLDTRADIVHSNCLMTHFDCAVVGRITRATAVLELHDIVAAGIGRQFMGVAVRLSGRSIAISAAVRDQLPRSARSKVVVVPQSVDVERFDDAGGQRDLWRDRLAASANPVVAAIGRIDPEKGLHVLIRAVALLRSSGVKVQLALVGSPSKDAGDYLAGLQQLGEELLGDALRIVPQVDDVPAVLRSIDILTCPSREEPFGLILLEAQACRVPVVATASGGPLDFIADGRTGLLVEPDDPHALAEAIGRLVADPVLRERIAGAGQHLVRSRYTAAIRSERFAALYRGLGVRR